MEQMKDAVVIGAGLAGLHCALLLERAGLEIALLEASDAPGGRIRTDRVDGFLLDRGFQVLLTAYPETQSALDYAALDLRSLKPGALVFQGGRFHRFADPFREPIAALGLAVDPIVTLGDKLGVARLRGQVTSGDIAGLFAHKETTTRVFLESFGFSPKIIERFFEPFFGGVFLERELVTSSRFFEFLFRMFSTGAVAVPAAGMQAIPGQLASRLKPGTMLLNTPVAAVALRDTGFQVTAGTGGEILARAVVIAVDEPEARRLRQTINPTIPPLPARTWNSTTAFYFAATEPPVEEPILLLNGEGRDAGPVNNAVVLSVAAPAYAPPSAHLISASVVGRSPLDEEQTRALEAEVRRHLTRWFGSKVSGWRSLGARAVPRALPLQTTARWEGGDPALWGTPDASPGASPQATPNGVPGIFLCGDYLETSSIQGSLASGRRAAAALMAFSNR